MILDSYYIADFCCEDFNLTTGSIRNNKSVKIGICDIL